MIDIENERIVTRPQAAKIFPHPGRERPPHYVSVLRWCLEGRLGVRLESIKIGRTFHTSHEAINRFVNELAQAEIQAVEARHRKKTAMNPRSDAQRKKAVAKAEKDLDAAGCGEIR